MSNLEYLPSSGGVILIADDTAESLSMLNEVLAGAGYTVLVAMDGQQALNIASRMTPDLILLDAIMPNLDGFETCKALKKDPELEDIPVIFMTGLSDSDDIVRGLECGGVDYLTKPVNLDVLLARVVVHLNNARKAQSARSALNEMGQPAFACNSNGVLLWTTERARSLLTQAGSSEEQLQLALPTQLNDWLARSPERHAQTRLSLGQRLMQVRFLGRPAPGEFLLRLVDDDELSLRHALRQQFLLTEREAEVLLWLSRGKTNQEIGQILSMSPRTVNKHLEQVFRKLSVENRTAAAAVSLGYLSRI